MLRFGTGLMVPIDWLGVNHGLVKRYPLYQNGKEVIDIRQVFSAYVLEFGIDKRSLKKLNEACHEHLRYLHWKSIVVLMPTW